MQTQPRTHAKESKKESLPASIGTDLMADFLIRRDIGDESMNDAFIRVVEQARNEFVRNARLIPKELPEAARLADLVRDDMKKTLKSATKETAAEAYATLMDGMTHRIKTLEATRKVAREEKRRAA